MCGILGSINIPFGREELDLIRHRGPDDFAIARYCAGNHQVTLGHRRLSIVDLSPAGRQPMSTLSENHSIVFNGEIYNHLELRGQTDGVAYRGHSDTETILNYLARFGISSVRQFNGIFAFGLVDGQMRKLYLARDIFGVKPLYYWGDDRGFVFSSELRPLSALIEDSLDHSNLAELLRLRYLPAPDTLFKKIRKVRPGHVIEVDFAGDRLKTREYPFLAEPPNEVSVRSRRDAVEQYGFLVEQAVKRQLMSDVEIGVFLSGGVDSAMIARIAQNNAPYRMKAFTVGFAGQEKEDEIADARETAQVAGLDHHDVRINFDDFISILPKVSQIVEEPLATTSMAPMFFLSKLASSHGKVMLSGQGADEAMGGYRRYRFELLRSYLPAPVLPILAAGAKLMPLRNDLSLRGLDAITEGPDVPRFEATSGVFTAAEIERLIGARPTKAAERIQYFFDLLHCSRRAGSVERMMALDLRMGLADDLLLYTDKITMHHSIECRVPLLDIEVVRYVESLPRHYRLNLFKGKVLHRQFAERLLPSSIIRRKKKGFLSPTNEWFKKKDLIREILLDPGSTFASHFDLREVDRILCEHAAGINRERHIFLLLGLNHWFADLQNHRNALPARTAFAQDLCPLNSQQS